MPGPWRVSTYTAGMDGTNAPPDPDARHPLPTLDVAWPTIERDADGTVHVDHPITATLSTISGDGLKLATIGSANEALRNGNFSDGIYIDAHDLVPSGPYLDDGRNHAVAQYLANHDTDFFFCVDSDVEFTRLDIARVLYLAVNRGCHIVSGCYKTPLNGDPNRCFTVAYRYDRARPEGTQMVAIEETEVRASYDPLPVDVVGMGFVAISRTFLTYMAQFYDQPCPWFYEPIADRTHLGEDVGFCLRARALGADILLDRATRVVHYKTARFAYD